MPCPLTSTWIVIACLCLSLTICSACSTGWFGPSCEYKCHCRKNKCGDDDGTCYDGVTCSRGWFGPLCQYEDLAQNYLYESQSWQVKNITDGDDRTCLDGSVLAVNMSWYRTYHFTWFRLRVKNSAFRNRFSFQFMNGSSTKTYKCKNRKTAVVDEKTVDIHCDLDATAIRLILTGESVKFLCSFYISGGRNVALKQRTRQSSTYDKRLGNAGNAVDGNINQNFKAGSCIATQAKPHSNLNITLGRPTNVNRYILYNRKDGDGSRAYMLEEFKLRCYSQDGRLVVNYEEPSHALYFSEFEVRTPMPESPVSLVNIEAIPPDIPNGAIILTLCEVEIYGDTACEPGRYGWNCENQCNCADGRTDCFVSTGGCPGGCAPGYTGSSCQDIMLTQPLNMEPEDFLDFKDSFIQTDDKDT